MRVPRGASTLLVVICCSLPLIAGRAAAAARIRRFESLCSVPSAEGTWDFGSWPSQMSPSIWCMGCASPEFFRARTIDVSAGSVNARAVMIRGFPTGDRCAPCRLPLPSRPLAREPSAPSSSWPCLPETVGCPLPKSCRPDWTVTQRRASQGGNVPRNRSVGRAACVAQNPH